MSVIVPIEMPKSCYSEDEFCPFHTFVFDLNGGKNICTQLEKTASRDKRLEHCPLVELPPHGRLIDADALQKFIVELTKTDYVFDAVGYHGLVRTRPTVLEASEA